MKELDKRTVAAIENGTDYSVVMTKIVKTVIEEENGGEKHVSRDQKILAESGRKDGKTVVFGGEDEFAMKAVRVLDSIIQNDHMTLAKRSDFLRFNNGEYIVYKVGTFYDIDPDKFELNKITFVFEYKKHSGIKKHSGGGEEDE